MNHSTNSARRAACLALCFLAFTAVHHSTTHAQSPLEPCAEQFIDGQLTNAPAINGSPPGQPWATNRHLCYRDDNTSFFAIEYWPEQFTPRWAAYQLSPQNYGAQGCSTYTRDVGNCYISETTWDQFLACTDADDFFHTDYILPDPKLAKNDFANTGHDRGHIAPRQAFSWHVCATYQTFTMANMSAQTAFLNQEIWQYLEEQILTWAVDQGPIYVVSGTMFTTFPHQRFQVYSNAILNPQQIYTPGSAMMQIAQRHHANFLATPPGDILRPKRDAKPANVPQRARHLRMPTGYFAVIYRPPLNDDPAHAIGFLLPQAQALLFSRSNSNKDGTNVKLTRRLQLRPYQIEEHLRISSLLGRRTVKSPADSEPWAFSKRCNGANPVSFWKRDHIQRVEAWSEGFDESSIVAPELQETSPFWLPVWS